MCEQLRARQRRERRDAILDACAEALVSTDEENISIELVADRAGVSRATVFNYFSSKREIVYAIAAREIDSLSQLADERIASGEPALEVVGDVVYHLVAVSFSEPEGAWRVLKRILDDPGRDDAPATRLFHLIERLVRTSMAEGELSNRLDAAGCARAIVGTYLAELYSLAASTGRDAAEIPGDPPARIVSGAAGRRLRKGASARAEHDDRGHDRRSMSRGFFNSIAEQLLSSWRSDNA